MLLVITGAIGATALAAAPALAQDSSARPDDQIVLTGRLIVAEDETVEIAAIGDGPAQVEGTVQEDLVVLNGDVDVSGTVEGDVFVFNGDVVIRSTAEIGGDLVTQATPTVEDGATIRGDRGSPTTRFDYDFTLGFAGRIAWWIGYSVSVLILGMLLLAFAPRAVPEGSGRGGHGPRRIDRMGLRALLPPPDRFRAAPRHRRRHPPRCLHPARARVPVHRSATSSRRSGWGAGC